MALATGWTVLGCATDPGLSIMGAYYLSLGSFHTGAESSCVISKGNAFCVGHNSFKVDGGVGYRTYVRSDYNRETAPAGFAKVVFGQSHSCALTNNGEVFCAGSVYHNGYILLGNDQVPTSTGARSGPVPVMREITPQRVTLGNVVDIAAGDHHTCALLLNRELMCWGSNELGALGLSGNPVIAQSMFGSRKLSAFAAGFHNTAGIVAAGEQNELEVMAQGDNSMTQLSDDAPVGVVNNPISLRNSIGLITSATQVSFGRRFTLILLSNGNVLGLGINENDQLGQGRPMNGANPATAPCYSGAAPIHGSGAKVCQVRPVLGRWALGAGQLLRTIVAVSASGSHACALKHQVSGSGASLEPRCWGNPANGRLGLPGAQVPTPHVAFTPVPGQNVDRIMGGANHSCMRANGEIMCWGENDVGQIPFTPTMPFALSPVRIWQVSSALLKGAF